MSKVDDLEAQLRETTNRMKAWRNAFFVSVAMFLLLVAEMAFDFV